MGILELIRAHRRRLGLSQASLAAAAGVSLATIQNVEAGRANPALSTLEDLMRPLGLSLQVRVEPADWDGLVALGLPLTRGAHGVSESPPAGAAPVAPLEEAGCLRRHVARAAEELAAANATGDGRGDEGTLDRRRDALRALVFALHTHFPGVTGRWLRAAPAVRALLPPEGELPPGRVVKLARIARARLAEYL